MSFFCSLSEDFRCNNALRDLFELICEVVCVKRRTVKIGGEDYPYELVKAKFLKLTSSHLEYVIGCMKKNTTKIANIKAYMITTLYNAPSTINQGDDTGGSEGFCKRTFQI